MIAIINPGMAMMWLVPADINSYSTGEGMLLYMQEEYMRIMAKKN